jgi:hypothetical protein
MFKEGRFRTMLSKLDKNCKPFDLLKGFFARANGG